MMGLKSSRIHYDPLSAAHCMLPSEANRTEQTRPDLRCTVQNKDNQGRERCSRQGCGARSEAEGRGGIGIEGCIITARSATMKLLNGRRDSVSFVLLNWAATLELVYGATAFALAGVHSRHPRSNNRRRVLSSEERIDELAKECAVRCGYGAAWSSTAANFGSVSRASLINSCAAETNLRGGRGWPWRRGVEMLACSRRHRGEHREID
jgi:hypothetical protein